MTAVAARAVALAALVAAAACAPAPEQGTTEPDASAAVETRTLVSEEGPVRATVELAPAEPRLGDPLTLTLTVEAAPDVAIEMPAFGEALGRFSIVDFTPRSRTEPDGRTVASQRYTLHAPMSGRQRIPPLRIEYVDQRETTDPDAVELRELLTDEVVLQVESVLPDGAVADELRPVRAELEEIPQRRLARWGGWVAALAALVAAALGWSWWRRYALRRAKVTAYDKALARLARLERRGLPGAEEADAWYVELSDVVRRYLEDRFAVRAPELTTEEFLNEARRSAELGAEHRELLSHFLEQCDRVKFAAYHPDERESREALAAARRFLDETRLRAPGEPSAGERPAA